jgi:hypothetical protein
LLNAKFPAYAFKGKFQNKDFRSESLDNYGLLLVQVTGHTCCAYCGNSFIQDFDHWLTLTVDHVIASELGIKLGIPLRFTNDIINKVLACAACNGYDNRYFSPSENHPWRAGLDNLITTVLRGNSCSEDLIARVLRRNEDKNHPLDEGWTLPRRLALRDAVFSDRKPKILRKRQTEEAFFQSRLWEYRLSLP